MGTVLKVTAANSVQWADNSLAGCLTKTKLKFYYHRIETLAVQLQIFLKFETFV